MGKDFELNNGQRELLTILAEECGKVVQRVTKILRFGMRQNPWTDEHNQDTLELEMGDFIALMILLEKNEVVNTANVYYNAYEKIQKMKARDGRLRYVEEIKFGDHS